MSQNPITRVVGSTPAPLIGGRDSRRRSGIYEYDFAKQGGAIGALTLSGPSLPEGAVIVDSYIDVRTVPTSGGSATISVGIVSAIDLNSVDAISGAPWSSTGQVDPDNGPSAGAESGYIRITSSDFRVVRITVAVADLTAGKFFVVLVYDIVTE